MWAEIVKYFVASAGIGAFLYFAIKLTIEKFMEAGLERYRSALRIDLETHKAELSRITQEHRIRFEYLHPERFSTIRANTKVEGFVQIRTEIESEFRRLLGEVS